MILLIMRIEQLILQIMVFFLPSLGGPSNCRRRDSTYHVQRVFADIVRSEIDGLVRTESEGQRLPYEI